MMGKYHITHWIENSRINFKVWKNEDDPIKSWSVIHLLPKYIGIPTRFNFRVLKWNVEI